MNVGRASLILILVTSCAAELASAHSCPKEALSPQITASIAASRKNVDAQKEFFDGTRTRFFRGVAQPGYNEPEMMGFLFGNRAHEPRSWALTRRIEALEQSGTAPDKALSQAEADVSAELVRQLGENGKETKDTGTKMMSQSILGMPLKRKASLGLSFSDQLDEARGYAETAFRELDYNWNIRGQKEQSRVRAMVWEIQEDQPSGIGLRWDDSWHNPKNPTAHYEYQAAIRLSCHQTQGAYFGYQSKQDAFYKSEKDGWFPRPRFDWFHLRINSRDPITGLPNDVTLFEVEKDYFDRKEGLEAKHELCRFNTKAQTCVAAPTRPEVQNVIDNLRSRFLAGHAVADALLGLQSDLNYARGIRETLDDLKANKLVQEADQKGGALSTWGAPSEALSESSIPLR